MKLVVVGTGFIGGSFAKAAAKHGLFSEILGLDTDSWQTEKARRLGIIQAVVNRVPDDAAAVLLAPPSEEVAAWVCGLADHPGVVLDVASVKQPIVAAVRNQLPEFPQNFVPTHPICGSERSGPEYADAGLFRNQTVVLTPEPETSPSATGLVQVMWRSIGARVRSMSVVEHDRALALTSHLPHLLSSAYVNQVDTEMLALAAGGFRDFTRIAAANPVLWEQIFRLNKEPLIAALDAFRQQLGKLENAIRNDDTPAVQSLLEAAVERRREFDDI